MADQGSIIDLVSTLVLHLVLEEEALLADYRYLVCQTPTKAPLGAPMAPSPGLGGRGGLESLGVLVAVVPRKRGRPKKVVRRRCMGTGGLGANSDQGVFSYSS